jgi:hypothetical protein
MDVVERLLSQPVSRRKEPPAPAVPDQEREHAAQILKTVDSVFFVKVEDGLGVGVGAELASFTNQATPQFLVVVDLTVEDDPDRAIRIAHRLLAAVQIDDAQTPMTQRDVTTQENPFVVRPAVSQAPSHLAD